LCRAEPAGGALTSADAVIALQIAAGSRPPDPALDVSRDGSVTSPGRSDDPAGGGWGKRRLFLSSEQDE